MWIEKNGPTWRIRDLVNGSKVTVAPGYATKTAAKDAKKLLEADKLRGELLDPAAGGGELEPLARQWWTKVSTAMRPNTTRSELARLECHLLADLGHMTPRELEESPAVIQAWVADMRAEGLAPKTIRNIHGQTSQFMSWLVDERIIRSNPCARTTLPPVEEHEMRFLTVDEGMHLVECTAAPYRDVVRTFLGTGNRWGELAGYEVRRWHSPSRLLTVVKNLTDRGLVLGPPKSKTSKRGLLVPEEVAVDLDARARGKKQTDWLFRQPRGGPLRYEYFRQKVWTPATRKAELPGLRIHDLRHTYASWLISAGVPLTAVSRLLGHKSIAITSDRYGHLLPEVYDGVVQVLSAALSGRGILGETNPWQRGATRVNDAVQAGQAA